MRKIAMQTMVLSLLGAAIVSSLTALVPARLGAQGAPARRRRISPVCITRCSKAAAARGHGRALRRLAPSGEDRRHGPRHPHRFRMAPRADRRTLPRSSPSTWPSGK
jgi:hypothetical protein